MKNISLNYGAVRDTVYRFAGKQFIVNENNGKTAESTILNSFLKSVKSTPSLKMQNIIFENFEKGRFDKESLAERYIAQNLKLAENTITWEKLITENRDVRISLLENCHVEGESDVKSDLYENIHTLLESVCRKGFTEINKANEAYDAVLNHLLRKEAVAGPAETINETEEYPKLLSRDFITKLAVNNFNKRYAHLNENEKSLLKVLLSPDENKSNYLNDLKSENIEMIDSILNSGTDEGSENILVGFKEKMLSENSVGSNMDESIIHLAELKETLENFKR